MRDDEIGYRLVPQQFAELTCSLYCLKTWIVLKLLLIKQIEQLEQLGTEIVDLVLLEITEDCLQPL